jgi:hypothetical protein
VLTDQSLHISAHLLERFSLGSVYFVEPPLQTRLIRCRIGMIGEQRQWLEPSLDAQLIGDGQRLFARQRPFTVLDQR